MKDTTMDDKTERRKKKLRGDGIPVVRDYGLSTGSTLLNLACSGRPSFGMLPGHFYLSIGDSQAGKTWLSLLALAEAANDPRFDTYRLIFDQPERGALMNYAKHFGSKMADRIQDPCDGHSTTVEGFYESVFGAASNGPFVYILDSEDSLRPRRAKKVKRDENGNEKGSYGTEKAKLHSEYLCQAHEKLCEHGSILLMVKQSRDNIGFDAMFNPKTRSGGKALTFFATLELWFSVRNVIKEVVLDKKRVIGSNLKIHVKKNRESGRDRTVVLPFRYGAGIDEVGSMVQFLIEENRWTKNRGKITAPEFEVDKTFEALVTHVEENGLEKKLRMLVSERWHEIESACETKRKKRYE